MGSYSDLCEMYGGSPSDPDFLDNLLDQIDEENRCGEYQWLIESKEKKHFEILEFHLYSVEKLCEFDLNESLALNLQVMAYGHVISALEGYLSGVFINLVTNSDELLKKLIESDPDLANRKFSLKEIYEVKKSLKITIATYLKDLIFHNLRKVKPMYRDVLNHDFGDIEWLFKAISIRHDCVHRAGFDKDGNRVDISIELIYALISNVKKLVSDVEETIESINQNELLEIK